MAKELTELGEWKVGMEVIVYSQLHSSVHKISRITDGHGGTIYVPVSDKSTMAFDSLGNLRSADPWAQVHIQAATPELKTEIQMKVRQNKLFRFDLNELTLQQASDLVIHMREQGIKI